MATKDDILRTQFKYLYMYGARWLLEILGETPGKVYDHLATML